MNCGPKGTRWYLSLQLIIRPKTEDAQKTEGAQKTEDAPDRSARIVQRVFPSKGMDEGVVYDRLLAMPLTAAKLGLGLCILLLFYGLLDLWSGRV